MVVTDILKGTSRFHRLARVHGLSVAGDAMLTIALADSVFFDVDPNQARWRVALYLILTIAPFAVVAPFLGPLMDRIKGGHRSIMMATIAVRIVLLLALVRYVSTFGLYPLAFGMLVMGKTYSIAKSSLVPTAVDSEQELVLSNATLSITSAVAGGLAAIPGLALLRLGSPWVLAFGAGVLVVALMAVSRVESTAVAPEVTSKQERLELRTGPIRSAVGAMSFVRWAVGFFTILVAFELRGGVDPGPTGVAVDLGRSVRDTFGLQPLDLSSGGEEPWKFGLAIVAAGLGGLSGSVVSPRIRKFLVEERILAFALVFLAMVTSIVVVIDRLTAVVVAAFAIGLVSSASKQAFDAIVQRDAPAANLGRVFGRLESRFQLVWVFGAIIPAVLPISSTIGFVVLAGAAIVVATMYWFGRTVSVSSWVGAGPSDHGSRR